MDTTEFSNNTGKQVSYIPLSDLWLDKDNPRFGFQERNTVSQTEILTKIVEDFGVDDVLSSLAVNGYFSAEPMVCRKSDNNKYIVVEGNRRLAACLILAGDERAREHIKRTRQYQELHEKHGKISFDPVAAIIFDTHEEELSILAYLGVRHIVSLKEWDSYAKATWVSQVVEKSKHKLSIDDIASMIGDKSQTIKRMLQGYYFMKQLHSSGKFLAENSIRKGRGSNVNYPFSWVYTLLGYKNIREFLEIDEDVASEVPVPEKSLDKAGILARAMFGDSSIGRSSALEDSRQLGQLATVVSDPEKLSLLKQGKTINEIDILTKPIEQRLEDGLTEARDILKDIYTRITEQSLPQNIAEKMLPISDKIKRLSTDLNKKLLDISNGNTND